MGALEVVLVLLGWIVVIVFSWETSKARRKVRELERALSESRVAEEQRNRQAVVPFSMREPNGPCVVIERTGR